MSSPEPSLSAGPSSASPDHPLAPTTSRFFRKWTKEFSLITGYGIANDERVFTINRRSCERWRKELLNYSPSVVFMLKHLRLAGADVQPQDFPCTPCDLQRSGGFSPETGSVVLCQGNFMSKKHMEQTMVHEMVHMYDHVKFNVDWRNLRHHACSEIRANSLSGDCSWLREIGRGNIAFSRQHQACVRRRAVMSVMANPSCPDQASAERAVNEVWESCFNDTRPFDEIY